MLVLGRKVREKIKLSNGVIVSIEGINGNRVKVGIEAPKDVHIKRSLPCLICKRPSFEFYLGYNDLPFCGHPQCAEAMRNDKSLFD